MENIALDEVAEFIKILEIIYKNDIAKLRKKISHLKDINIEAFMALIKKEIASNNIKSKYDVLDYIEEIVQD